MPAPLALEFVTSARRHVDLPPTSAEVAIAGRSNVGKSSLINALANRKALAKVSGSPGRTQLLNLFRDRHGGTVVDLPGYGFAKAPQRVRGDWPEMIEGYLLERDELVCCYVLVDGEIGPTPLDVQMLDWLRAIELPFTVVATKHDKVKPAKRERRKQDLALGCGVERSDVVWVSAHKGVGIDRLRSIIAADLDPSTAPSPAD